MAERTLTIEVIHVDVASQVVRRWAKVPAGSTVMQAIAACGIAPMLPVAAVDPARLGIFGRKVTPDELLHDGDRVEIYRPLVLDPREARRRRTR
ncbi:MAG: RnfH family protein [Rhodanobacter sp.]